MKQVILAWLQDCKLRGALPTHDLYVEACNRAGDTPVSPREFNDLYLEVYGRNTPTNAEKFAHDKAKFLPAFQEAERLILILHVTNTPAALEGYRKLRAKYESLRKHQQTFPEIDQIMERLRETVT